MIPRVLAATRSHGKLREIREILGQHAGIEVDGLGEVGLAVRPEEDGIEVHPTFAENALAKARYFAEETGRLTMADDSGLCVDALGGAPGVRSKRFSGRTDLEDVELDAINNELLLERLTGTPESKRTARFICAVAVVTPGGSKAVFEGSCEGMILTAPTGSNGFGYDPLFYVPAEGAAFAEIRPERKNLISHRARALRLAASYLRRG